MSKLICDRRTLLRMGGVAAAGLTFLPFVRRTRAEPGPTARARRLLVLNLAGGVRSSAAFHASPSVPYNPYGLIPGSTPFALGRILDDTAPGLPPLGDADYILGGEWAGTRLPRLREVAGQFSVVGTWSEVRGDHLRARIEEPTGSASGGDPGLLTRVAAAYDEHAVASEAPPFHLAPSALFGNGNGALTKFVPVSLAAWYSLPAAGNIDTTAIRMTGNDWAAGDAMREAFDVGKAGNRHAVGELVTSTLALHRRAARTIGARLAQPDMAVADQNPLIRAATLGSIQLDTGNVPLSNGMLYDAMTRCLGPDPAAQLYRDAAINAALAIRMLQLGSPAVCLEISNFDFHSAERMQGPPLYGFLGRLWAALRYILPRIPDPSGEGSLFDRTLVTTMSDFGRDEAGPTGWNGGEGSDHGADYACFYLAHAVMGAGTQPNRLIGPVDTNSYDARNQPAKYTPEQLLVTDLHALGLDPHNEVWGLPTGGDPIMELWS